MPAGEKVSLSLGREGRGEGESEPIQPVANCLGKVHKGLLSKSALA